MKKRNFAVMMLMCITLAGCGNSGQEEIFIPEDPHYMGSAESPDYSEEEIDKIIQEVGERDTVASAAGEILGSAFPAGTLTSTNSQDLQFQIVGNNRVSVYAYGDNRYRSNSGEPKTGYSIPYGGVTGTTPNAATMYGNTEDYNAIAESGFVSSKTQRFATFGADVDTAAYTNLRRSIRERDGYGISRDAIRLEEMINYFSYDYAKPTGDEKFGVTTSLAPCPWNEDSMLLRVGVRAKEVEPQGGSNIVFLIDTSGSMYSNDKLPLAQAAFKTLQENLTADDTVSIVTYAGSCDVVLEGARGDEHQKIVAAIDQLQAGGGTNGEGGIRKAYEIAEKYFIEGGNNRVILATDGDLNIGISSEADLTHLVEEEKETGVFLSCLGFGIGNFKDDRMEALADHGNGNYAYIDCTAEAERVLKNEMWSTLYTVAKDVKFQVEFNPAQVKGYRQIGYENRVMAAEDFADDTKDGGEVGSNQCVTVLYEVVLADSDYEIPEVESRYAVEDETTINGDELLAVNIRYKEPDSNTSVLRTFPVTKDMISDVMDDDTSWAAGVAQVGMLLRESDYAGTSEYDDVIARLKQCPKVMTDDFYAEFIDLAEDLAKNGDDFLDVAGQSYSYGNGGYNIIVQ